MWGTYTTTSIPPKADAVTIRWFNAQDRRPINVSQRMAAAQRVNDREMPIIDEVMKQILATRNNGWAARLRNLEQKHFVTLLNALSKVGLTQFRPDLSEGMRDSKYNKAHRLAFVEAFNVMAVQGWFTAWGTMAKYHDNLQFLGEAYNNFVYSRGAELQRKDALNEGSVLETAKHRLIYSERAKVSITSQSETKSDIYFRQETSAFNTQLLMGLTPAFAPRFRRSRCTPRQRAVG